MHFVKWQQFLDSVLSIASNRGNGTARGSLRVPVVIFVLV